MLAITRTTIEEAAIYNKEAALMLDRAASLLLWIFTAMGELVCRLSICCYTTEYAQRFLICPRRLSNAQLWLLLEIQFGSFTQNPFAS